MVKIKPLGKVEGHPNLIEFELLDLHQVWAMGPSTHFVVWGRFEFAKELRWKNARLDGLHRGRCKVVVQPNYS